jgi:thiamine pyrophosphokinase
MAGAATVVETLRAIMDLDLKINVTAYAALAENMPSASAQRPSDVVTTFGGKTIEVLNTDAEGRLVLADALGRAQKDKPDLIIEIGTFKGGGALYFADLLNIIGKGEVHTINIIEDVDDLQVINNPRIKRFTEGYQNYDINLARGFEKVLVLGSTGGQHDHFLGNLNAAFKFREQLSIKFFDQSQYFFLSHVKQKIVTKPGKVISLIPFPQAQGITLSGLQYLLNNESLSLVERIGTRNIAVSDTPSIHFESGALWIFVEY